LEEDLVDGWKKIWWMVGIRSVGWLDEDLVDSWKKYGGWFEKDLVKGCK
jgi:hypothetical protein